MRTRVRSSLHIGLNYPGTSAELAGCVNDARDWQDLAVELGYRPLTILEPSRAALLGALEGAVGRLRYGDRLLVTYSGHGSWVPDRDGDEPDGRDEALVPSDYRTTGLLLDDELLDVWTRIPFGARVVFVSDSCHSGSVTRFASLDPAAVGRRDVGPAAYERSALSRIPHIANARFLPPAEVLLPDPGPELERLERAAALPVAGKPRPSRVALLSGCRDDEVSYDATIDGRPRGAASWAYLAALRSLARPTSTTRPTLAAWHAEATRLLVGTPYEAQHPQLSATSWQARAWSL